MHVVYTHTHWQNTHTYNLDVNKVSKDNENKNICCAHTWLFSLWYRLCAPQSKGAGQNETVASGEKDKSSNKETIEH